MIAIPAALLPTPSVPGSGAVGKANPTLSPGVASPGAEGSFFALLADLAGAPQGANAAAPIPAKKTKTPTGTAAAPTVAPVPLPANGLSGRNPDGNGPSSAGNRAPRGALAAAPVASADAAVENAGTPPPAASAAEFPPVRADSPANATEASDQGSSVQTSATSFAPNVDNSSATNLPDHVPDDAPPLASLRHASEGQPGTTGVVAGGEPLSAPRAAAPGMAESFVPFHAVAENQPILAAPAQVADPTKEPAGAKTSGPNVNQGMDQAAGTVGTSYAAPGTGVEAVRAPAPLTDQVHERAAASLDQLRQSGHVEMQMNLHPPELGPVQLHLALDNGQLNVHFLVQNDGAKSALDHQMDPLRARFAEMGLTVGQFDVRRDGTSHQETAGQSETPAQTAQTAMKAAAPTRKSYDPVAISTAAVDVMA